MMAYNMFNRSGAPPGAYPVPIQRPLMQSQFGPGWTPPGGYDQFGNPLPMGAPPGSISPISQQNFQQFGNPYNNQSSAMPDWETGGNPAGGGGDYGPIAGGPAGGPAGGGGGWQSWFKDPTNLGTGLAALGSIWGAYTANKNAKANQKAVSARQQYLDQMAGGLA